MPQKIGDAFDWVMAGSPCGSKSCSGMQGGAGLVAIKYTQNPQEVAKVMDYLASAEVQKEFAERSLFIPAHKGVAAQGLSFKTDNPNVQAALSAFVQSAGTTAPEALKLAGLEMGGCLLRRACWPRQPGNRRRDDARGRLRPHR